MSERRKLARASESDLARKIREAVGVGPDEEIHAVFPTFDRPNSWPSIVIPPTRVVDGLRHKSAAELCELGCKPWDEVDADGRRLMLFPAEWFDQIPKGCELESISGRRFRFDRKEASDDRRFGLLAFGVRAEVRS